MYLNRNDEIQYRLPRISMTKRHSPSLLRSAIQVNLWSLVEFREEQ